MNKLVKVDNIMKNIGSDLLKLKLDGFSYSQMYDYVKDKYPTCSSSLFSKAYNTIILQIVEKSTELSVNVINQHINRYEEIYNFFMNYGFYNNAKKALFAKEKLLGFHSDVYQFEVNKLNMEERKEFIELIQKAKIS